ncbi:ventrally expressed dharma/bozozok antagonist [Trichomycterus rosablanca]|uniref:ventrally expressed dharma/bozozok antagonist n=1 Tax=Trichomycterus rosablanca TaxID=2290929 RepID=UPI002F35036B
MKGHFSVEWLSQSSQVPYNSQAMNQSSSWISAALDRPSTSGTVPESLPGFYSRRADNIENQRIQSEPVGPTQSFNNTPKQETRMNNAVTLHHVPESGFSSGTEEEETSGYESEGGRSLSPMASKEPAPSTSPGTGRRARTAFTAEQIESLERAFKRNAYLGAQDKAELCKRLNLSDKQIRNWFQNRRMKLKRTVQDALAHACQANVASQLMHYPELQSYRPAPYPTYYPAQESHAPYLCPPNSHYTPSVVPTLPANTLYQYRCPQGLPMAPSNQALMQPYQPYPHQYFSSQ